MKRNELNTVLRDRARQLGLCDQWYEEWKNETPQQLIEKYLKGIDFCIKHDYPKLDFVKAYFNDKLLLANGIFVDKSVDASNILKAVLLGKSKGELRYYGQRSCDVYVRHESDVEIVVCGGAKVFVETYDDCKLKISADEYSKAFVYKHGGTIDYEGNVVLRNKMAEQ